MESTSPGGCAVTALGGCGGTAMAAPSPPPRVYAPGTALGGCAGEALGCCGGAAMASPPATAGVCAAVSSVAATAPGALTVGLTLRCGRLEGANLIVRIGEHASVRPWAVGLASPRSGPIALQREVVVRDLHLALCLANVEAHTCAVGALHHEVPHWHGRIRRVLSIRQAGRVVTLVVVASCDCHTYDAANTWPDDALKRGVVEAGQHASP